MLFVLGEYTFTGRGAAEIAASVERAIGEGVLVPGAALPPAPRDRPILKRAARPLRAILDSLMFVWGASRRAGCFVSPPLALFGSRDRRSRRARMVGPVGFEPTTKGL